MTHCATCHYWNADPNDNGMGACSGLIGSGRIEINVGAEAADTVEIFTPHDHYCEIGQEDTPTSKPALG
jgi:hypothetical protein